MSLICFLIDLLDYPERVSDLIIEMVTMNTVSVRWRFQMNGTSPRNRVDIEIKKEDISVHTVTEEASAVASTILSLSPLTLYSISVYVVSSVGRSRPSSINASTLSLSKNTYYNVKTLVV